MSPPPTTSAAANVASAPPVLPVKGSDDEPEPLLATVAAPATVVDDPVLSLPTATVVVVVLAGIVVVVTVVVVVGSLVSVTTSFDGVAATWAPTRTSRRPRRGECRAEVVDLHAGTRHRRGSCHGRGRRRGDRHVLRRAFRLNCQRVRRELVARSRGRWCPRDDGTRTVRCCRARWSARPSRRSSGTARPAPSRTAGTRPECRWAGSG